jgi:hypothetical protein
MKTASKFLLLGLLATLLAGCYDLVNQPLGGLGGEKAIFSIAGKWVEKEKNQTLEINETDESDEFTFVFNENGKVWKGLVEAAYYEKKVVLNLDLVSLSLNGEKLIQPSEPMYLLIGIYFKGDKLHVIPADMQKFKQLLAEHFYATPVKTLRSCVGANEVCKQHFSDNYVLSPSQSKKFDQKFEKNFMRIFPGDKATIFVPQDAP